MRSWTVKSLFLMLALLVSMPMAAAAQEKPGTLGVGVSFLSDEGGTGVTVDYRKPFRTLANERTLDWIADFSYHRNSVGDLGFEADLTSLTFQGGVGISGQLGSNEKVTWHGQGLIGVNRASVSGDDLVEDLCDELDVDCDASDSRLIFSPGAGVNYWFNQLTALRAQLDIIIGDGGSGTRFWIGISRRIGQ